MKYRSVLRLSGALAVAAVLCAAATACAPSDASTHSASLPEKDIETWALPLDPFLLSDKQMKETNYASALLVESCLVDRGVNRPVPYVDFDAAYEGADVVRSQLTRHHASSLGYHSPKDRVPEGVDAWETYRTEPWSDLENQTYNDCYEALGDDAPQYGNKVLNFTSGFASAAYAGAVADPEVAAAAAEWRECMEPQGIEDLPDDPSGMPTESMRQEYFPAAADGRDGDPAAMNVITPDEIRAALADLDCRESSGYQQTFYDALWDREASTLQDNAEALEQVRAQIEAVDEQIDEVVSQHASAG